jgi:hypothetical protein
MMAALVSCGQQTTTTDSSGDTSTEPAAFDASTATVTDQPFCDQVDTTLVGAALDMSPDGVKLVESREVGDKVEGPDEESGPITSQVNSCSLGSSTAQFVVTVQPDASAASVQKLIDFYTDLGHKGFSSETCTVAPDAGFGDPAVVADCKGTGGSRRRLTIVTGLVGTSKFFCSTLVNSGSTQAMRDAAVDACRQTLQTLAEVES